MPPTANRLFAMLYVGLKITCRFGVTQRSSANKIFQ